MALPQIRYNQELCSLLTKAFELAEAVDTNPFRAKSKQLDTQIIGAQEDLEKTNTAITESEEKYDQENRRFIDLQEAKEAYQLIDRKRLVKVDRP